MRLKSVLRATAALLVTAACLPAMAQDQAAADEEMEEIVVIGVAPRGAGLPAARVPANVVTLGNEEIDRPGAGTLAEALTRRLGSISSVDSLGNPLQQGVTVRGFTAAPALGEPQGVAVYQGVMRANEAFGDVVQWDLLPTFAIDQVQVIPGSSPTYGPNTIGGAVVLTMKNGFTAPGLGAEVVAGSHGRLSGTAEAGGVVGDNIGIYAGANYVEDDGWRDQTDSEILRGYADLAWRAEGTEIGLGLNAARSELAGNGPAPLDLLEVDRNAVFTYPDRTESELFAATLRASTELGRGLTIQGGGYFRKLDRDTVNGDQAEFEECEDFVGLIPGFIAPAESLCFGAEVEEEDGELEVEGDPAILLDANGNPVLEQEIDADAVFNRTRTETESWGGSGQLAWTGKLGGMDNVLIVGGTMDWAETSYASGSELGFLQPDRGTTSLGIEIGNEEFNVGLETRSLLYGLYVSNTLSLTPDLHVTGALRWNRADLELRDQIGTALNGDHAYARVSPGVGVTWNANKAVTFYGSYTESERIPTPAELSCADPERPCRFPNAFLADPPLDEVIARTFEVGARGDLDMDDAGMVNWSVAGFRTRNSDDIIFISAGPIVGTGYFDNVGDTERWGVEANINGEIGPVSWYASYTYVKATFETALSIQAPDNPFSDEEGEIAVEPGDRIPGVPLHSFKAGADVAVTDAFTVGAELIASSSRYLRGDEANLDDPVDGFAIINAEAGYRLGRIEIFGRVQNVFDTDYETFGIFGEADELGFENPRFLSPGAPRTWLVGARARF